MPSNAKGSPPTATRLWLACAVMVCAAAVATEHRDDSTLTSHGTFETLDVASGRLVGQAVQKLIYSRGLRISYEDPRYSNPDDLEDISLQVTGMAATSDESRIIVPKTRKMSVKLPKSLSVEGVLNEVVAAAAAADPAARFRVRKDGSMYHVVPIQESVLDTHITLAMKPRTASELFDAICAAVTSASGQQLLVGIHGYIQYEGESRYPIGAKDEPASAVLERTLDAIGVERGPATWLLLYGNKKTEDVYRLSIIQVPEPETAKPVAPRLAPAKKMDPANDYTSGVPK